MAVEGAPQVKELNDSERNGEDNREAGANTEFYVVRVDAPPGVEVPGGCYVTIESGPHLGLRTALHVLRHPKARAHTLPDIVFLSSTSTVWAIDDIVPEKPRLLLSAPSLEQARTTGKARPSSRLLQQQQQTGLRAPGTTSAPGTTLPEMQGRSTRRRRYQDIASPGPYTTSARNSGEDADHKRHRSSAAPQEGGSKYPAAGALAAGDNPSPREDLHTPHQQGNKAMLEGTLSSEATARKTSPGVQRADAPPQLHMQGGVHFPHTAAAAAGNGRTTPTMMMPFMPPWGMAPPSVLHPAFSMMMSGYPGMMMAPAPGFSFPPQARMLGAATAAATVPTPPTAAAQASPPRATPGGGESSEGGSHGGGA